MCCTDDALDEADLYLCQSCLCCTLAVYPAFPQSLGCSCKQEVCCVMAQGCLKLGQACLNCTAFGENALVQCGVPCCAVACKVPTACCKSQLQVCCLVVSLALPPDEDLPPTCSICCLSLWPKLGPCVKLHSRQAPGVFTLIGAPSAPEKNGGADDPDTPSVVSVQPGHIM